MHLNCILSFHVWSLALGLLTLVAHNGMLVFLYLIARS